VPADTAAPQARYRVLRGIVHHLGGVARPGDVIALPPQDGDPLCTGPIPVLARAPDHAAPAGSVEMQAAASSAQTPETPEPEPAPASERAPASTPKRSRKAPR
jgi:hypothetical protein